MTGESLLRAPARTEVDNRPTLPDWHQLSAAFRGKLGRDPGDNPIIRWARDLASLHRITRTNPRRTSDYDQRRGEIADLIDTWVSTHVPPPPHRCPLSERPGIAVDRIAGAHVEAEYALRAADTVTAEEMHDIWFRVGLLAVRWADLVAAIVDGQPPVPWPPARTNPPPSER